MSTAITAIAKQLLTMPILCCVLVVQTTATKVVR